MATKKTSPSKSKSKVKIGGPGGSGFFQSRTRVICAVVIVVLAASIGSYYIGRSSAATAQNCRVTLRYGNTHPCVKLIQAHIDYKINYSNLPPYTTYFGTTTRSMVVSFQQRTILGVGRIADDGVVGRGTYNKICSVTRVGQDMVIGGWRIGCSGSRTFQGATYYRATY